MSALCRFARPAVQAAFAFARADCRTFSDGGQHLPANTLPRFGNRSSAAVTTATPRYAGANPFSQQTRERVEAGSLWSCQGAVLLVPAELLRVGQAGDAVP